MNDTPLASRAVEGRWARALVRFNLEPVDYAEASWLPTWAPQAHLRVRRALSHALLCGQDLEANFDWQMKQPAARFFMMDTSALDQIGLAIGIAAHRDSLRQVVRKDHLAALGACFGDAFSTLWLGVAETVPHAVAPLSLQREPLDPPALGRYLAAVGKSQLLRLLDDTEPASRAAALRAAFRLPRATPATAPTRGKPLPASLALPMGAAIETDLIPRLAPQWAWLF